MYVMSLRVRMQVSFFLPFQSHGHPNKLFLKEESNGSFIFIFKILLKFIFTLVSKLDVI